MIYEWIEMAEKDLVLDARAYGVVARTDIANFYPSIYTHSIAWALHSREDAFNDARNCSLFGSKIDKLFQYSNDCKTNGIPIGSGLCDPIAEVILADVDRSVSRNTEEMEYVAVRFKDDYRVLCNSEEDAKRFLDILARKLSKYNLSLNESKTVFLKLPDGLYRQHDREYYPHTLREKKSISFKNFEYTLLKFLEIHRKFPGTSILEKFIAELFDKDGMLKINFSHSPSKRPKEVRKAVSLLFLLKRESTKLLCHVLSVVEALYLSNREDASELKRFMKEMVEEELKLASAKESVFEAVWLVFFSKYLRLGANFNACVAHSIIKSNNFYRSVAESRNRIFTDSGIDLFTAPKNCKEQTLAQRFAIFRR